MAPPTRPTRAAGCSRTLTGREVDDVTLLTALGFREEVSNLATPWVPPLESPLGPPGGATRVNFWGTGGFFTAGPGTGRLVDCPVEGGCAVVSLSKPLELLRDSEAWHPAGHRVPKSQTRLGDLTELKLTQVP